MKTFMLVLAIGNISFAVLIAGYARTSTASAGLRVWQWAKLIQGTAHLFGFGAVHYELAWMDVAANTLLIGGIAVEVAAYAAFLGLHTWLRRLWPLSLLLALILYASWNHSSHEQQIFLRSLMLALFSGMMAYALLRHVASPSFLQRLVAANQIAFVMILLLRGVTALIGPVGPFTSANMQMIGFLSGYAFMIINGFGFLLLCKQRDDQRMEELATIDSLTGVANRRAFFERTEIARMLSERLRQPLALMMLDIDHFKRLNDRFGHATGDDALCIFAQTVRKELREHDILGRLGGEEFALAMPGTDLEGALHAAERLRVAVSEAAVLTDGNSYMMTVSVGVVLVGPQEPINSALARADNALYAAKTAGRNRVESGEALSPRLNRA